MTNYSFLANINLMKDKKIAEILKKEVKRQQLTLNLIASENYVSKDILETLGSILTNKYSEGYPNKRYYPGNVFYDEIEILAQSRGLAAFGLKPEEWHVNVQPYSGSPANIEIYLALMQPGETLMAMNLAAGGHLSHGHPVSASGKFWRVIQYGVNKETGLLDYNQIRELALKEKPKVIVCGFTAYPREFDFKKFGDIAKESNAYLVADISHIAGLVAAGVHSSPFADTDVVMTTTHKTLRGPRGAVIFVKKDARELGAKIDRAVFPGMQGGPHNNETAAKAVAFLEAQSAGFKKYQKQIVKNASALAAELIARGFKLMTNGTDNHLMLLDMRKFEIDGRMAEELLEHAGITANRNSLPEDSKPLRPSGVRLGTPAITTRKMKEQEMKLIAIFFERLFVKKEYPLTIKRDVEKLCKKFPINP